MMTTKKKVSIIIPAYNVQKYMRRCLDSLVSQTYEAIEIIVVNDGSTDRTEEIVQEYVEQYPGRVMLFSKENEGQAEARNYGLTKATGEYVGFVDSDDFVSAQMYEKMVAEAEETGCDLVTCGYYGCDAVTGEITVYQTGYRGEFNQSIYENPLILRVNSPYPWNKLYTRELLDRTEFQFKKGMIFEDLCAIFPLFLDAKKVGRVHEKLYYYIKGREGGTISTFNEKHGQILDALQIMNDAYQERGMFETFYNTLLFFNIRHIYARFDEMKTYEDIIFKREFKKRAYALLDMYFPGWKESEEFISMQETAGTGEVEEDLDDSEEESTTEDNPAEFERTVVQKSKGSKRRSQIFEELVATRGIEKNTILVACYHGNDWQGMGYHIARNMSGEMDYKIYVAAADEMRIHKFTEREPSEFEFVDMNSIQYLEILATAEYVVNNRAFPGFYRKRKEQRFLFVDFLPSLFAQGREVTYGTKDIQGTQLSLAQADQILFPEELREEFVPLLERYHMADICRDKGWFVPCQWLVSGMDMELKSVEREETKIAYMPSIKEFPGLRDVKCHLFLSDLKKKLKQFDELLSDGITLWVCFPRVIRRRFRENEWKHIEFFPENEEPSGVLATCDALIGEYGEEMFFMKALGKPVCQFARNTADIKWCRGLSSGKNPFPFMESAEEVVAWMEQISKHEGHVELSESNGYVKLSDMKKGKNRRVGRNVEYLPAMQTRAEFLEFMQDKDVERTIFFIEKESFDDGVAAWIRQYGGICYMVIIRSLVISKNESRLIKYHITTKDKLREKRDRERYLG